MKWKPGLCGVIQGVEQLKLSLAQNAERRQKDAASSARLRQLP